MNATGTGLTPSAEALPSPIATPPRTLGLLPPDRGLIGAGPSRGDHVRFRPKDDMFSKILIANRGEIAVRIIKTCRRMGIATVQVYSEADAGSLAVEMADEAVLIGPAPAAQSYLLADRIVDAVRQTGAEAVHPGFGFLSENAGFARRLRDEGIAFIGPNPEAIEAMGDKISSKKLA